jgi:hypothetical protein
MGIFDWNQQAMAFRRPGAMPAPRPMGPPPGVQLGMTMPAPVSAAPSYLNPEGMAPGGVSPFAGTFSGGPEQIAQGLTPAAPAAAAGGVALNPMALGLLSLGTGLMKTSGYGKGVAEGIEDAAAAQMGLHPMQLLQKKLQQQQSDNAAEKERLGAVADAYGQAGPQARALAMGGDEEGARMMYKLWFDRENPEPGKPTAGSFAGLVPGAVAGEQQQGLTAEQIANIQALARSDPAQAARLMRIYLTPETKRGIFGLIE